MYCTVRRMQCEARDVSMSDRNKAIGDNYNTCRPLDERPTVGSDNLDVTQLARCVAHAKDTAPFCIITTIKSPSVGSHCKCSLIYNYTFSNTHTHANIN